jgi:hypothetical protein
MDAYADGYVAGQLPFGAEEGALGLPGYADHDDVGVTAGPGVTHPGALEDLDLAQVHAKKEVHPVDDSLGRGSELVGIYYSPRLTFPLLLHVSIC